MAPGLAFPVKNSYYLASLQNERPEGPKSYDTVDFSVRDESQRWHALTDLLF